MLFWPPTTQSVPLSAAQAEEQVKKMHPAAFPYMDSEGDISIRIPELKAVTCKTCGGQSFVNKPEWQCTQIGQSADNKEGAWINAANYLNSR